MFARSEWTVDGVEGWCFAPMPIFKSGLSGGDVTNVVLLRNTDTTSVTVISID